LSFAHASPVHCGPIAWASILSERKAQKGYYSLLRLLQGCSNPCAGVTTLAYLQQDGDEATGYLQLMEYLETAWQQVCPSGPAEDDDGAVITFLALLATYQDAYDAQADPVMT